MQAWVWEWWGVPSYFLQKEKVFQARENGMHWRESFTTAWWADTIDQLLELVGDGSSRVRSESLRLLGLMLCPIMLGPWLGTTLMTWRRAWRSTADGYSSCFTSSLWIMFMSPGLPMFYFFCSLISDYADYSQLGELLSNLIIKGPQKGKEERSGSLQEETLFFEEVSRSFRGPSQWTRKRNW